MKITPEAVFAVKDGRISATLHGVLLDFETANKPALNMFGHETGETWGEALAAGRLDVDACGFIIATTPK